MLVIVVRARTMERVTPIRIVKDTCAPASKDTLVCIAHWVRFAVQCFDVALYHGAAILNVSH